jgi:hypothetical protein
MELALRWEWTEFALRALREGRRHHPSLLDDAEATVKVRGEGRLFKTESSQAETRRYFHWGASVFPSGRSPGPQPIECAKTTKDGRNACAPEEYCFSPNANSWFWRCERKPEAPSALKQSTGWYVVKDQKLSADVGAKPLEPRPDPSILHFITVKVTCGEKNWYGESGPPVVPDGKQRSLAECMQEGMKQNARLKAKSPQTLHFPDEVVVVAEFTTESESSCDPSQQADSNSTSMLCTGSSKGTSLDGHYGSTDRNDKPGAQYQGMVTGKGFPTGAVKEVHLRPEDLLMVENLLIPDATDEEATATWF